MFQKMCTLHVNLKSLVCVPIFECGRTLEYVEIVSGLQSTLYKTLYGIAIWYPQRSVRQSHNPSHLTFYPDVLKIKTIIVVKQIFSKMPFVYYLQINKSIIWQPCCQDVQAAELSEIDF